MVTCMWIACDSNRSIELWNTSKLERGEFGSGVDRGPDFVPTTPSDDEAVSASNKLGNTGRPTRGCSGDGLCPATSSVAVHQAQHHIADARLIGTFLKPSHGRAAIIKQSEAGPARRGALVHLDRLTEGCSSVVRQS